MALADLNVSLGLITQQFEKGIKSAERSLRRFGRQAEFIGQDLAQSITVPIVGVGAAAVKSFADLERSSKALEAVTGSASATAEQLERLRVVAQLPGLGFQEAVQASARLQAVGLSAQEAEAAISEFGNAVARSGGGRSEFDGAILALTQIASKGKISAEEINQLNERIFEIRPALESAFGTSNSEELQRLGISAEEFIARTTDELSKLERVQGGLSNAFENFGDSVRTSLATLGEDIARSLDLQGLLNRLSSGLENVANTFRNLDEETRQTVVRVAAFAAAIGPAFLAVSKLVQIGTSFVRIAGLIGGAFTSISRTALSAAASIRAFNAASALAAGGALVVLGTVVAGIVSTFGDFQKRIEQANAAQRILSDVSSAAQQDIAREKIEVERLTGVLNDENRSRDDKERALNRLRQINPEYFGQLEIEQNRVEGLTAATNDYIKALERQAKVKAAQEALVEIERQLLDTQNQAEEASLSFGQRLGNALLGAGNAALIAGQNVESFTGNVQRNRDALLRQKEALLGVLGDLENVPGDIEVPTFTRTPTAPSAAGGEQRPDRTFIAPFADDAFVSTLDLIPDRIRSITTENRLATQSLSDLGANTQIVKSGLGAMGDEFTRQQQIIAEFANGLSAALEGGIVQFADGFADAFAKIATSGGDLGDVFTGILDTLLGVLERVGKLAIQTGVALLGITTALKTLNPFAAIAAGTALLAVVRVLKAGLTEVTPFAEGGIVTGPTLGLIGEAGPEVILPLDRLNDFMPNGGSGQVEVQGVIRGDDIYLATVRASRRNNRTGGQTLSIG